MIKFQGAANTLGLVFFGTMTASISHEVKNCLAIVNENAGLLEDLLMLAEKGRPLNFERLKQIATDLHRQADRANGIVGKLNRFAHSAEHPIVRTTTQELCEFTISLAERLAMLKKTQLHYQGGKNLEIQVRPFVFFNLLWLIFEKQFTLSDAPQQIQLSVQEEEIHIAFMVQFDTSATLEKLCELVMAEGQPLITVLRAGIVANTAQHQIRIVLPKIVEE